MQQPPPIEPDVLKNPSYPRRLHTRERARWNEVLASWDRRIADAQAQAASRPDQAQTSRTLGQMLGARDQIADAVGRLPVEAGDLYHEDEHRVALAVAALERIFARW